MRYFLFGSSDFYYARGGIHDLLDSSDDIGELTEKIENKEYKGEYGYEIAWWHIYDAESKKIVLGTNTQAHGAPYLEGDAIYRESEEHGRI